MRVTPEYAALAQAVVTFANLPRIRSVAQVLRVFRNLPGAAEVFQTVEDPLAFVPNQADVKRWLSAVVGGSADELRAAEHEVRLLMRKTVVSDYNAQHGGVVTTFHGV